MDYNQVGGRGWSVVKVMAEPRSVRRNRDARNREEVNAQALDVDQSRAASTTLSRNTIPRYIFYHEHWSHLHCLAVAEMLQCFLLLCFCC